MAEDAVGSDDWSDEENDFIVADYFNMLASELAGARYSKADHNRALQRRTGRSKGSIEFKHQNISAVLGVLGRPTIRGYRARYNVQGAIFEAIDRFLTGVPAVALGVADTVSPFRTVALEIVSAPTGNDGFLQSPRMLRLIRKVDPAARDARNRSLGEAGEAMVVDFERERLARAERLDLARKVRWVSKEDGDGAGYDIHSFTPTGAERLIEVKSTNGAAATPFFITRNEKALAEERSDAFRLYRVHELSQRPRLFKVRPPIEAALWLTPEVWRAGVK